MITYNTASNSPSPVAATSEVGTDHPSVSLSLPLVQLAVQQHILRGEFIGFNTLLLEVMFLLRTLSLYKCQLLHSVICKN